MIGKREIELSVRDLEKTFYDAKAIFLTEDDVKIQLCHRLLLRSDSHHPTYDEGINTGFVHTEIPFYDEKGKLTIRPDVVIIDPGSLSIKHGVSFRFKGAKLAYGGLPSKGFEFSGQCRIIEIKFCRSKKGYDKKHVYEINKDIKKLSRLHDYQTNIFYHLLTVSRYKSRPLSAYCMVPDFIHVHEIICQE